MKSFHDELVEALKKNPPPKMNVAERMAELGFKRVELGWIHKDVSYPCPVEPDENPIDETGRPGA